MGHMSTPTEIRAHQGRHPEVRAAYAASLEGCRRIARFSVLWLPPFEGAATRRHLGVTAIGPATLPVYSRLIRRTGQPAAWMRATASRVGSIAVAM